MIAVLDAQGENVLMCLRRKPPYQGLWNLVGGKLEPGESGEEAAYRELFEETAIPRGELALWHVMDFVYHASAIRMEVWAGRLARLAVPEGGKPFGLASLRSRPRTAQSKIVVTALFRREEGL